MGIKQEGTKCLLQHKLFVYRDKPQRWDISKEEKERNRCHYRINYRGHYKAEIITSIEDTVVTLIVSSWKTPKKIIRIGGILMIAVEIGFGDVKVRALR